MKPYFRSITFFAFFFSTVVTVVATDFDLEQVSTMRLRGELEVAQAVLASEINTTNASPDQRIQQHLEMARIQDRMGLHYNTRPVAEALAHIELAANLLDSAGETARASVELAYAHYYYRAEMRGREFNRAEEHARLANKLYAKIDDSHGQADAVHLLGLMKFHRKKLDLAEALFEESLRLDILAGERVFFRGEYERHVGYIAYQRGDFESAVRHFERSLEARIEAGAIDASMFAAISLASVLIESGHPDEAKPHLDYALAIAQEMDSPVGLKRVNEAMERWSAAPVPDVK